MNAAKIDRYSEDIQGGESVMRHKVIWITAATVIMMPLYVLAFSQGRDAWFSETPTVFTHAAGGDGFQHARFADFDQDGFADAAVTGVLSGENSEQALHVFKGLGTGAFSHMQTIELREDHIGSWGWVNTGDINGDGWTDIIVMWNTFSEPTEWATYLNTGGTGFRCAGDVDGDGQTRVEDLVGLLEDWGCDDSAQ